MNENISVDSLYTNKLVIENDLGEPVIIMNSGDNNSEPAIQFLGENKVIITTNKILLEGQNCGIEIFIKDDNPDIKITQGDREWLWSKRLQKQDISIENIEISSDAHNK